MRVTDKMLFRTIGDQMRRQTVTLFRLQEQISSGKKVNRPSDDPVNHAAMINSDKTLSEIDQFLRNIGEVDASLSVSESALQAIEDQLLRASELAVLAANDTHGSFDRAIIAKEVRQLYDQIVSVANTSNAGHYIFAGHQTTTVPFVNQGYYTGTAVTLPVTITAAVNDQLTVSIDGTTSTVTLPAGAYATGTALAGMVQTAINGDVTFQNTGVSVTVTFDTDHLVIQSNAVGGTSNANVTGGTAQAVLGLAAGTNRPSGTYLGDSGEIRIAIDKNNSVIKNLPGDRLFKGASGGIDILAAMAGFQVALETNTPAGIQTALANLKIASEQVIDERVKLGARLNRLTTTSGIHDDFKLVVQRLKSEKENVDIASSISDMVLQQNALEITRSLATRIFNMSLMDFLR